MGLYQALERRGAKVPEYAFWSAGEDGHFKRVNMGSDVLSRTPFPWTLSVEEGELGEVLTEDIHSRGRKVEHLMELLNYQSVEPGGELRAYVKNHTTNVIEIWIVKYLIGCDGQKSRVRQASGIRMDFFGELDLWAAGNFDAESNFPDIRRRSTARSPYGNCALTPGINSSIRLITRLSSESFIDSETRTTATSKTTHDGKLASSDDTIRTLQSRISNVLLPYAFSITGVHWVEYFALGKCLARSFSLEHNRLFLLGSACHVHSPLSKQMINGGLLDALNLTWKLALVLDGFASASLLDTYEGERRTMLPQALELEVQFDRIFTKKPGDPSISAGFYGFEEASGYTSGLGLRYPSGVIVKQEVRAFLKKVPDALVPGKRLLPLTLIRNLDGNEINSLEVMPPDGRFTVLIFAGELLKAAIFQGFANFLSSVDSPSTCFNSVAKPRQSRVKILLIHSLSHFEVSIPDLPQPFPRYPEAIFEDLGGKGHMAVGVSPEMGSILCCMRPDGYIGFVSNLDDLDGLKKYLRASLDSLMGSTKDAPMELG